MSPTTPVPPLPGRPCSAAAALSVVGEKWALLAVREILFGNRRFDAIARNTGAPRDRLTARLRALEESGIVERRAYNERPPRYEYHLTRAGRDLAPVIRALVAWGDRWVMDEPPVVLRHRDGHPVDTVEYCRTCGEEVHDRDLEIDVRGAEWTRTGPAASV
ncbi:helix-turn-helix domain-containing protein [Streptomyces sp. NPDC026673]|uniref:winged helix-turn-helix transcriptional regulator n=1 Tax=Streptomyces sp. NPDC026673 TaxID=3155724 RepID=UPI0033CB499E